MTTEQPPPFREAPTAELLVRPAAPPSSPTPPPPPLPPPPLDHDPGEPVLPPSPPTYDPSPFGSSGRVLPPLPAYSRPATPPTRDRRQLLVVVALCSAVVAALVTGLLFLTFDDDGGGSVASQPSSRLQGSSGLDIQALLAKAQPSVVTIQTDEARSSGAGTGVIISSDGEILTNAHVVARAETVRVILHDGTEHVGDVIGSFPDADVAMVRVQGASDLVAAQLGTSADARVGDEVVAIGNALNLGATPSVTRGIISALDRMIEAQNITLHGLIQTDAAINPGNSGGPLLNAAGEVIGINTAIAAEAQNIGFAIPIDDVKPLLQQLRDGQGAVTPDTAFLGVASVSVRDLTTDDLDQLGVTASRGAVITEVTPDSAAADAGLEPGDVVVEVEGVPITSSDDLQNTIAAHEAGDEVTIEYERNGRKREVTVELGRRGG